MSVYIGDGEPVDVERSGFRRARKPHRCCACNETIQVGHRYHYSFEIFDGSADSWKRCARCQLIYEHLVAVLPYDEAPDYELNCGHTYEEVHGEPPPDEIAALAFLSPGDAQRLIDGRFRR